MKSELKIYVLAGENAETADPEIIKETAEKLFKAYNAEANACEGEAGVIELKSGDLKGKITLGNYSEKPDALISKENLAQLWDFTEAPALYEECKMYAECVLSCESERAESNPAETADFLMDEMMLLPFAYPGAKAVYIVSSGRLFTMEKIAIPPVPHEERFIYYGVNARFFGDENDEMLIDTVGMSVLSLPDLQYHFKGLKTDLVVEHAYNMLYYLCSGGSVPENGDTVFGISENGVDEGVSFTCRIENAIMAPSRTLIDIYMNEFACGVR